MLGLGFGGQKKIRTTTREGANTEAKKKNLDMNTKREIPEKRKG